MVKVSLRIPTSFCREEVNKEDAETLRKKISELEGKAVLIAKREGSILMMGVPEFIENEREFFMFKRLQFNNAILPERVWYHDIAEIYNGVGLGFPEEFEYAER